MIRVIGDIAEDHEFELDGAKYLLRIAGEGEIYTRKRNVRRAADNTAVNAAATYNWGVTTYFDDGYGEIVTPTGRCRWKCRDIDVIPALGTDVTNDWYIYKDGHLKLLRGKNVHYEVECPTRPHKWCRSGPYDGFDNGWIIYHAPGGTVRIVLPHPVEIKYMADIGGGKHLIIAEHAYVVSDGVIAEVDADGFDECFSIGGKLYSRNEGVVRTVAVQFG